MLVFGGAFVPTRGGVWMLGRKVSDVNWPGLLTTLATLAAGAVIGFAQTLLLERRKEQRELRTRWDTELHHLAVDFVSAVETCRSLDRRYATATDKTAHHARSDDERGRMWLVFVQLRFVGDERVQRAARMVVRHSWAYREIKEGRPDPREGQFGPQ